MAIRSARNELWLAAEGGAVAWMTYGFVEYLFASLLPRLSSPAYHFTLWHLGFGAVLFVCYTAAGLTFGLMSGLAQRALANSRVTSQDGATDWTVMGSLSLVLVFAANLVLRLGWQRVVLGLLLFFGALAAAVITSRSPSRRRRWVALMANPVPVTITLLGLSYITLDLLGQRTLVVRLGAAAAVAAAEIACCLVVDARPFFRASGPRGSRLTVRRLAAITAAVLTLSLSLVRSSPKLSAATADARTTAAPNVLLVVLDTVRADHLSVYGYGRRTSPELEALTREATVYKRAFASADMTLPTHASMFTGLYPREHGAHPDEHGIPRALSDGVPTVAEILEKDGYATIEIAANHAFLGAGFGLDKGFDYADASQPPAFVARRALGDTPIYLLRQSLHKTLTKIPLWPMERPFRSAADITNDALHLLDKASDRHTPFFMFLNFMDAHQPYRPPPPFDRMFPGKIAGFDIGDVVSAVLLRNERSLTERERAHLLSQYDGAIAYMDQQIGRLLGRLRQLGLYDNTLVIVTADHGEAFGRRGLLGHWLAVYQDEINVPLVIKYPRSVERRVEDRPVSSVDIAPTILAAVGMKAPHVSGTSLIGAGPDAARCVFSESFPNESLAGSAAWSKSQRIESAVICGNLKLISSTSGKRELYELASDPTETRNLYAVERPRLSPLQTALARFFERPLQVNPSSRIDKAVMERLRSVGYIR